MHIAYIARNQVIFLKTIWVYAWWGQKILFSWKNCNRNYGFINTFVISHSVLFICMVLLVSMHNHNYWLTCVLIQQLYKVHVLSNTMMYLSLQKHVTPLTLQKTFQSCSSKCKKIASYMVHLPFGHRFAVHNCLNNGFPRRLDWVRC